MTKNLTTIDTRAGLVPTIDTKTLAKRWGVTPGHLANLRAKGLGPDFTKPCGRVMYRIDVIEAYEQERTVTPVYARGPGVPV